MLFRSLNVFPTTVDRLRPLLGVSEPSHAFLSSRIHLQPPHPSFNHFPHFQALPRIFDYCQRLSSSTTCLHTTTTSPSRFWNPTPIFEPYRSLLSIFAFFSLILTAFSQIFIVLPFFHHLQALLRTLTNLQSFSRPTAHFLSPTDHFLSI